MPAPALPFWMRQRQMKAEPLGETGLRLTAPNLPIHELVLEGAAPQFRAVVHRVSAAGAKETLAERVLDVERQEQAWLHAYELFRQQIII